MSGLERFICWLSPTWGLKRLRVREALEHAQKPDETQARRDTGGWKPLETMDDLRRRYEQVNPRAGTGAETNQNFGRVMDGDHRNDRPVTR